MKLNISAAWEEAVAMVTANREVLIVLAGVFFLLPSLAMELFIPKPTDTGGDDPAAALEAVKTYWIAALPYFVVSIVIQSLGQLAVTRLVAGPRDCTVGEVLREAAIGLPILVLTQLLLGLVWMVAGGALIGIPAAAGSPVLVFLLGVVLLGVAVWAGMRLSLIVPAIAIDGLRNPFEIIRRSWELTRGNAGSILLFIVLLVVAAVVLAIIIVVVGGAVATLTFGAHGGEVAVSVLSSLFGAAVTLYVTTTFAAIHRQLTGATDSRVPGIFS